MAETRTPVDIINVEYVCDEEGCNGKLVFTNKAEPSIDPKVALLIHVCNKCKKTYKMKITRPYPRQEFVNKVTIV